ncbi:MAG: hypothetical protein J5641_01060 [Bacteroidales bacterium]|nr:hypothetical protein [Bacteroidales bacterium]
MDLQHFFKLTPVKLALITLAFALIIVIGLIPLTVVLVMDQTLFIRILIAAAGIIWAILTLSYVSFKTDYWKMWRQWRHELKHQKMSHEREKYPEYMALREKYPLAIRRYEQHTRHRKHRISEKEMIEQALKVSEEEWAAREEFRRQANEERHQAQSSHSHL